MKNEVEALTGKPTAELTTDLRTMTKEICEECAGRAVDAPTQARSPAGTYADTPNTRKGHPDAKNDMMDTK